MSDSADANLVLAAISSSDALHARARGHLARTGRLVVPLTVSAEILHGAHKRRVPLTPVFMAIDERFEIESRAIVSTAARAVDEGFVRGVFDALHAADAFHQGRSLHTADERLLRSGFPTVAF